MDRIAGIGIYMDTARFVHPDTLFNSVSVTKERTVESYELVFFLKNGGYTVINGKKYLIRSGAVRFLRPGDKVYSARYNEIYVVHFFVDDHKKGAEMLDFMPSFTILSDIDLEIGLVKDLINSMITQNDFDCLCTLWTLLGQLKKQIHLQKESEKAQVVFQIKKYIDDHFSLALTLDMLAKAVHMHPIYLQRKFKNDTGMTPMEYQKKTRIAKAKTYLLSTDLTVCAVSELCGFCNTSYFIRVFKDSEGVTPLQFREQTNRLNLQYVT